MLPPGLSDSSLIKILARTPAAIRRNGISGVCPIAPRIDHVIPGLATDSCPSTDVATCTPFSVVVPMADSLAFVAY
jgi:hypothetical protein